MQITALKSDKFDILDFMWTIESFIVVYGMLFVIAELGFPDIPSDSQDVSRKISEMVIVWRVFEGAQCSPVK